MVGLILKYRHKLKVKHILENTHSVQEIAKLSEIIIDELETIQNTVEILDNTDIILGELDDLIKGFETVIDFCTEEIPESDWESLGFHGNYFQLFNEYMNELYRIANEIVNDGGVKYKFILIE